MRKGDEDPTHGWAWDEENQVFMQPSVLFPNRWKPVKPSVWEADNPIYQYDPQRHPTYTEALNSSTPANKKAEKKGDPYRDAEAKAPWYQTPTSEYLMPEHLRKSGKRTSTNLKDRGVDPSGQTFAVFDGDSLILTHEEQGRVIDREAYAGVSGKRDEKGEFNYTIERQSIPNSGPLPEGFYSIRRSEPLMWDDLNNWQKFKSECGGGYMPGGKKAWGVGKVGLYPKEVEINGVKRGNFTIHGGAAPGSRGCIDIMDSDKAFFEFLERYQGAQDSIPVTVDYTKKKNRSK